LPALRRPGRENAQGADLCAALRISALASSPLGILLVSGVHDRALTAFSMAACGAAIGRPVVLFASNQGCRALMEDWSRLDDVGRDAVIRARGVTGFGDMREAAGVRNRAEGGGAGGFAADGWCIGRGDRDFSGSGGRWPDHIALGSKRPRAGWHRSGVLL
jgi:hypothetical protein